MYNYIIYKKENLNACNITIKIWQFICKYISFLSSKQYYNISNIYINSLTNVLTYLQILQVFVMNNKRGWMNEV